MKTFTRIKIIKKNILPFLIMEFPKFSHKIVLFLLVDSWIFIQEFGHPAAKGHCGLVSLHGQVERVFGRQNGDRAEVGVHSM